MSSISSRISDVQGDIGNALDSLDTLITLLGAKAEEGDRFVPGLVQLLKVPRGIVSKSFNDLDEIEGDIVRGEVKEEKAPA
jgi:hypothetical protein